MRNKLIIGLAVFAFLLFFIPKVEAANGQLYQVDSEKLMVRATADPQGEIVSQLYKGDLVTVFSESFGWGRTFFNGQEAWVAMHHLSLVDEAKETADEQKQKKDDTADAKQKDEKMNADKEIKDSHASSDKKKDAATTKKNNKHTKESDQQYHEEEPNDEADVSADQNWQTKDALKRKLSSAVAIEKADKRPLDGYHFVIDPGHGGKDPGTKGADVLEKSLTLSTAKRVSKKLHDAGATVTMTRTDDTFISLARRVQISNSHPTDAFISLHFNSYQNPSVRGLNTFYYAGGQDQKLAKTLQSSLVRNVKLADRGARKADYYVLRNNKDLAVLIELGFLTNPQNRKTVQTKTYQEKVAKAIAKGLEDYFEEK